MGELFIVSTPIGNLEDITLRALRILKEVDVIACEDTRMTRRLLTAHGISTPVFAYHAHNAEKAGAQVLARLEAGHKVALVTDAGTPLVSDPGAELVRDVVAHGFRVTPIPGPSALLAALVAAGVTTHPFVFLGFVPRGAEKRRTLFLEIKALGYTAVLFEAPGRVKETLESIAATMGETSMVLARELTKIHEEFLRGTASEILDRLPDPVRGEVVLVLAPAAAESSQDATPRLEEDARRLLASGMPAADIARTLAGAHGLRKKEAYQLVLRLKNGVDDH